MLVASSLRDSRTSQNDNDETIEIMHMDDFSDFSTGSLLDSINFDELFAGLDDDSDVLPDLEILGDYSIDGTGDEQGLSSDDGCLDKGDDHVDANDVVSGSGSLFGSGQDTSSICSLSTERVVDNEIEVDVNKNDGKEGNFSKLNKSATPAGRSKARSSDGKRKVKVDWTPDLHKRFVQAVEQLGEKAVPSRILEVMGTDGLTRHNIASHLQKYRSHRKHLMAREAEAASWNQRRHIYGGAARRGGGIGNSVVSPWLVPTIGFPQCPSMLPQPVHHSLIRPLHVWGHPSAGNHGQNANNMWPKHVLPYHVRPPHLQPQPVWAPPRPIPYGPSQGMPFFPPPSQGFVAAPVSGIPHHTLYNNTPNTASGQATYLHSALYSTPLNERIDAALEDVLAKPWLPLPIGLKPPATDTVVGELQRQGVPQLPSTILKLQS